MSKSHYSEEQIIGALRLAEAGQQRRGVCRQHGISETTCYRWNAQYGGLEVSQLRRLRTLAAERPRWGYCRLHIPLQRDVGSRHPINHKRVQRLYRLDGLAADWSLKLIAWIHATLGAVAVIPSNPKRRK